MGFAGFGGKASKSFGQASSIGKTTVNTSAESSGSDNRELEARYQQYIRVRLWLASGLSSRLDLKRVLCAYCLFLGTTLAGKRKDSSRVKYQRPTVPTLPSRMVPRVFNPPALVTPINNRVHEMYLIVVAFDIKQNSPWVGRGNGLTDRKLRTSNRVVSTPTLHTLSLSEAWALPPQRSSPSPSCPDIYLVTNFCDYHIYRPLYLLIPLFVLLVRLHRLFCVISFDCCIDSHAVEL